MPYAFLSLHNYTLVLIKKLFLKLDITGSFVLYDLVSLTFPSNRITKPSNNQNLIHKAFNIIASTKRVEPQEALLTSLYSLLQYTALLKTSLSRLMVKNKCARRSRGGMGWGICYEAWTSQLFEWLQMLLAFRAFIFAGRTLDSVALPSPSIRLYLFIATAIGCSYRFSFRLASCLQLGLYNSVKLEFYILKYSNRNSNNTNKI